MSDNEVGNLQLLLLVALLSCVGCETDSEPEAEATPPGEPQEQVVGESDEGAALPPAVDGASDEEESTPEAIPRFEIDSNPHREELHRPKIEARETSVLDLHDRPDTSSEVVDRLEVEAGEEIEITGDSKMLIFTEVESVPEPITVSVRPVIGGEGPYEIELEEGDRVSYFLEYGGEGTYIGHLWYRDDTYRIEVSAELNDLFDTDRRQDKAGFDFERDQWWIETEGSDTKGWLLVSVDEFTTGPEVLEDYR